jgi:hypothetical protein
MAGMRRLIAGASLAGAMAIVSTPAWATVYIGAQEAGTNGGALTTVASGATNASFDGSYGTFDFNSLTAIVGVLPVLLNGQAINAVQSSQAGTLNVYITYTGITSPLGALDFKSGLTTNLLPTGWTVMEQTFVDPSNSIFGTTTPLASKLFTDIGTSVQDNFVTVSGGPYSVTELFTVNATGAGATLSTIRMGAAVPEPASWAMMLLGFFGVGAFLRRARSQRPVRPSELVGFARALNPPAPRLLRT